MEEESDFSMAATNEISKSAIDRGFKNLSTGNYLK